jgi:hypothetical protein
MSELSPVEPEVKSANIDDFFELCDLIDVANEYSIAKSGLPAWQRLGDAHERLKALIESGHYFVIRNEKAEITSGVGLKYEDRLWEDLGENAEALYFVMLMKHPRKALPGEGQGLIRFAAKEALRLQRPLLRCDAVIDAPHLIGYYHSLGLKDKGDFVYLSGRPGLLLEVSAQEVSERIMQKDEI